MQGPTSRPFSPLTPSPADSPAQEAAELPGSIQSPTAADTPLTRRLKGWDRAGESATTSSSQVPRSSVETGASGGPRRLVVDGKAEVRDPRIVPLAEDADLSDDEDTDVRMPPARVGGQSPDTSFAVSDPAWDALWTSMSFLGAKAGLSQQDCASLLRDPGVRSGLLTNLSQDLAAAGYPAGAKVPDRVMARIANDLVSLVLQRMQSTDEASSHPPPTDAAAEDDGLPSLDDLQGRFDALAAQVAQLSPPAPGDRKSGSKSGNEG